MVANRIAVGLGLPSIPPLAMNRFLTYAARFGGLHSLWSIDHQQLFFPGVLWNRQTTWAAKAGTTPHDFFEFQTLLGNLAPRAGRLRLGVGVTDATRRHPALTAQAMLTLAHMVKRPPILGIGTGLRMNLDPYGIEPAGSLGRLREGLEIIRRCFASQHPSDFTGQHYRLEGAVMGLRPPKGRSPEIWIAGNGPTQLDLTGRYGDGWFPALLDGPEEYAAKLETIRASAHEAGRDPNRITPSLWQSVLIAPSEQEARSMLETTLVRTLSLVYASARVWRQVGGEHPFGDRYRLPDLLPELDDRGTWETALAQLPPELVGYGFMWGTAEQVANQLRRYGEAGLRHVTLCDYTPLLSRRALVATPRTMRMVAQALKRTA
jgi:phthiodiolone/phenolphthiodiolone dimycocerosates ketoreductase